MRPPSRLAAPAPLSVSVAPTPRPPRRGLHPQPSPSASELPTAVETRTLALEDDSQSSGCLFSESLPAPHAGLHTAPHTPLRTALLRLAHASNQRRERGRPIRSARGERALARGRCGAGQAPPPRSASSGCPARGFPPGAGFRSSRACPLLSLGRFVPPSLVAFPQPGVTAPASRILGDCPGQWSRLAGAGIP